MSPPCRSQRPPRWTRTTSSPSHSAIPSMKRSRLKYARSPCPTPGSLRMPYSARAERSDSRHSPRLRKLLLESFAAAVEQQVDALEPPASDRAVLLRVIAPRWRALNISGICCHPALAPAIVRMKSPGPILCPTLYQTASVQLSEAKYGATGSRRKSGLLRRLRLLGRKWADPFNEAQIVGPTFIPGGSAHSCRSQLAMTNRVGLGKRATVSAEAHPADCHGQ